MEFYGYIGLGGTLYDTITAVANLDFFRNYNRLTRKQLAQLAAAQVPKVLLNYGSTLNGIRLEWTAFRNAGLNGRVHLQPLLTAYETNWKSVTYFGFEDEDVRLKDYKPLDFFTDTASVGVFYDAHRSPELYHTNVEEAKPLPTGVDIHGYFELLVLSLGFSHWPSLLVLLASPEGEVRPFRIGKGLHGLQAEAFVEGMKEVVPDFTLERFVARYDEVKLPTEKTWVALATSSPKE